MSDVPLAIAILIWNPAPRDTGALVVAHPEQDGGHVRYGRSAGACWAAVDPSVGNLYDWPRMSEAERMAMLLSSAWQAVIRDGVSASEMHEALSVIPEYRAWTPDMFKPLNQPNIDYIDEEEID